MSPVGLAPGGRLGSVWATMRSAFVTLAGLAALALAGCQKDDIASYRVPKEKEAERKMPNDAAHAGVTPGQGSAPTAAPTSPAPAAAAPGSNSMASTPVATASGSGLTWKGPSHWQEKPASGMRKGTFTLTGEGATAELSITAFPGDVGGEVANVNRWRGQVQLAPQSPSEVEAAIQRIDANGLKIGVVDMTGTGSDGKPSRTIGAMVPHGGATWFFKLSGPAPLLEKEKAAFFDYVKTIKPAN